MTDDIDMEGWPSGLREVARVIGPGPALRLIDAYAGRDYLRVPVKLPEGHALIQAIGEESARALVAWAPASRIEIPTLAVKRILQRKRLIRQAEGSTAEIARRFGVTPRWVRLVKSETKSDARQMDLFGPG